MENTKKQNDIYQRIIKDSQSHELNRRQFLSQATAAGLSFSSASLLWSNEVRAQTPQKGGHFRLGIHDGNTTDSLDPGSFASIAEITLAHTHRSFLTEITPENTLGPDLADSWSASSDASKWTFQLNKNATFQSGRPVTAKDVIASLNYHRGDNTSSAAKPLLADVTDIIADGEHTITISMSQGFADLPWILTDYHFVICPAKEDGSIDWQSGDGCGSYKITNFEPGIAVDLTRHEGWHREGAYFDSIGIKVITDANARQTALITNEVDAISLLDLKTLHLFERHKDIIIDNVPSGQAATLPMFCDLPPFDNKDVRLALKHAINRQEIVDKTLFGTGIVGNDFHVSPNMPYYPESIEQRIYDPDKAKFHLKQAGFDSLDVDLSASDSVFSGAVDMCVQYAEHAKAAGININVVREPADGYWSDVWLKKPFVFVKWGARPTPDNIFTLAYKQGVDWNDSHWENERFNELLLIAKAELDEELRAEMYHEMCMISRDDGGTVLPIFANFVYARRSNIQHSGKLAASWEIDGCRACHRWWFS